MKKLLNLIYNQTKQIKIINNVIQYIYLRIYSKIFSLNDIGNLYVQDKQNSQIQIAFICDEMTWQDFNEYCDAIFLHPKIWRQQIEKFNPKILFCESAWSGIDKYAGCWRGRIYNNKSLYFENRKELLEILEYCKENNIITVFWNKEDPTYFEHKIFDFVDTALKFDYIFTTAEECVKRYNNLGHNNVFVLPFGVNTNLFYPSTSDKKENAALFAGSWYQEHIERCNALKELFDYVLDQGLSLDIYDRQSISKDKRFKFPEKYKNYIHDSIPYKDMPDLMRKYSVCINVNTVTESQTMFSRRILQILACEIRVLTNYSVGIEKLLSKGVHITYKSHSIIEISSSFNYIKQQHSSNQRLNYIINTVGLKLK